MMPDSKVTAKISEFSREREAFRHYPTLLSGIAHNHTDEPLPNLNLSTSTDPILTALAQLGACRTGASRAFISLVDQSHQYIIAEATQTSSLRANFRDAEPGGEQLWFCGTAIPRSNGICQRFLNSSKDDDGGRDADLPVNVITDIRADPGISEGSCDLLGFPARGYVAVPIRSRSGIDFGVYSIVKEQCIQIDQWSANDSQLLREISQSIVDHLRSKVVQVAHNRAGKMTRGVGSFVEQRSTLSSLQPSPNPDPDNDVMPSKAIVNAKPQDSQSSEEGNTKSHQPRPQADSIAGYPDLQLRSVSVRDNSESRRASPSASLNANSPRTGTPVWKNPVSIEQDPLTFVFSRAANIIRESIDVEGVVYLDASVTSFGGLNQRPTGGETSRSMSSQGESTSSDDAHGDSSSSARNDADVLAFSTSEASSIDMETYPSDRKRVSSKILVSLLQRYPTGAIFNYDENGTLQSSDSSDNNTQSIANATGISPQPKKRTRPSLMSIGGEVLKAFPGARSVAFVPVWDQMKQRWRAGCFAWTYATTRFFTTQGDISYLRAFATLAMAEVARLETYLANQAQSDVLGSLSHELRSPLHGIILGVEFLTDTSLSVFQGNLLHILETCGRTLSDTIDHLLYYAKVNNFIPSGMHTDSRARGLRKEMNYTLQAGMKTITTPVRVDVLVEEVIESIFAGFNFQRLSVGQLERDHRKEHPDVHAIRRNDTLQAADDLDPRRNGEGGSYVPSNHIVIDLDIDSKVSHHYLVISGAVRRILMNLFGNALKYTNSGSIRITLSQESMPTKKYRSSNVRLAKIVVTDTGKGISDDFLNNYLYHEFQQEDSIGPGLGLGLSVVKKIVSSMKGKVSIESQVGVGTIATVLLPLQPVPHSPTLTSPPELELDDFIEQRRELKGLRICFIGFDAPLGLPLSRSDSKQRSYTDDYQSIWNVCREDLAMEVVSTSQAMEFAPDIVLCEEAAWHSTFRRRDGLNNSPLVVVCTNALSAYHLSVDPQFRDSSTIIEFISQPTGPRKLAKILMVAFRRWVEKQDPSLSTDCQSPLTLGPISSRNRERHVDSSHPGFGEIEPGLLETMNSGATAASAASQPQSQPRSPSLSLRFPRLSAQGSRPPSQPAPPKKHTLRFMLVEDNTINMRILCAYMKKLGRDYVTAEDGQIAVDQFRKNPGRFHCIFMDISMPRLNGIQATRQIREFETMNHLTPSTIIALSGLASANVQQEAFASGINLFLTKPVKLQEISMILKARDLL
ncbi:hypothetical protein F5Y19DRAFT_446763 [Xylariaceae sp. FL1651]|nr:hypothetical protein F5Y19DRAFT_446763 [Xylariaceae sp. FL1651]